MRRGWLRGSTVTAVPTRRRRVRVAIELATWSDAEITERAGAKWISPSQTQSRPQASACWASSNASRNAETWFAPYRISSTKIPKCMTSASSTARRYSPGAVGAVKARAARRRTAAAGVTSGLDTGRVHCEECPDWRDARSRGTRKGETMHTRILVALVLSGCLAAGAAPAVSAADKDALVIALDTLGGQIMDPIMDTRAPHAHYHAPIWDSLVGFDLEKGGIGPGAAERWELAADGRSWTFYLRKGQRFHNGDPVTAHDVKFSLERVMSPESISSGAAALRRAVDRIEVVDDLTVRVYTKGVIPQFAASLSRAVFMEGSVMPKKYIETVGAKGFRDKPIGSGPWKFVQSIPGDKIEYEAVTYPHWRGTPQFKRLTLLLVPEQSTRLAMVRTGEAAIASIGPEAVKEARAGGGEVVSLPRPRPGGY